MRPLTLTQHLLQLPTDPKFIIAHIGKMDNLPQLHALFPYFTSRQLYIAPHSILTPQQCMFIVTCNTLGYCAIRPSKICASGTLSDMHSLCHTTAKHRGNLINIIQSLERQGSARLDLFWQFFKRGHQLLFPKLVLNIAPSLRQKITINEQCFNTTKRDDFIFHTLHTISSDDLTNIQHHAAIIMEHYTSWLPTKHFSTLETEHHFYLACHRHYWLIIHQHCTNTSVLSVSAFIHKKTPEVESHYRLFINLLLCEGCFRHTDTIKHHSSHPENIMPTPWYNTYYELILNALHKVISFLQKLYDRLHSSIRGEDREPPIITENTSDEVYSDQTQTTPNAMPYKTSHQCISSTHIGQNDSEPTIISDKPNDKIYAHQTQTTTNTMSNKTLYQCMSSTHKGQNIN